MILGRSSSLMVVVFWFLLRSVSNFCLIWASRWAKLKTMFGNEVQGEKFAAWEQALSAASRPGVPARIRQGF